MSQLLYEDVPPLNFLDELKQIFPVHYEELCVTKEYELEPDYDTYKRLADCNWLRCITCRCDGELIGYIVFIIQPHLHYKSCLTATEDIYYVKKEYRKGRVGLRLFMYAEQVLKGLGVNRVVMHTKVHMDNSRIFEYLGYKNTDKVFSKML
jgi:GNAT superfamily N-acetyltransferase